MSVHTKARRTKRTIKQEKKPNAKTRKAMEEARSIPWRESLKEHLDKYSEGGVLLRAHRNDAGLTQEKLGNKLKISQNHISEMENGKRPIGKEMAKRFSKFFKADYRMFL
jgi:ribosome-binding protein aMBF1 (putative translation factor)